MIWQGGPKKSSRGLYNLSLPGWSIQIIMRLLENLEKYKKREKKKQKKQKKQKKRGSGKRDFMTY